jgi:hypothetical protein
MKVLIERALYSVIVVEVESEDDINGVFARAERGEFDEEFDHHTNDNSNYQLVEVYED